MRAEPADDARAEVARFVEHVKAGVLPCPLDRLAGIPTVWAMTPDDLDAAFAIPKGIDLKRSPYFEWMTTNRSRAVFMRHPYSDLELDLALFGGAIPVEEVVVDFVGDKLNGITFSLYNRGDSGEITKEEFQARFKRCGKAMGQLLKVKPSSRKANPAEGLLAEGWTWVSKNGMAALEHNPEANEGEVEFLRLKIAPRDARGTMAAAFQSRPSAVKLSDLPKFVTKTASGDVFIKGIPMVDQGPKGYCVVASAQRLFDFYGIPADQHQIAQVAGTDARTGTSTVVMAGVLGKIDYRFKTRFKILCMAAGSQQLVEVDEREMTAGKPVDQERFSKDIRRHVDSGIPLLWALRLGIYPEVPAIARQAAGGHMRMIIGYNDATGDILFTDSWGAGHELKRMKLGDSYKATLGLFVMTPTVR